MADTLVSRGVRVGAPKPSSLSSSNLRRLPMIGGPASSGHKKPAFSKPHKRAREYPDVSRAGPRSHAELGQNEDVEPRPKKIKLSFVLKKSKPAPTPSIYKRGQKVEVTSDIVGFEGSWYAGSVVDDLGDNMYVVEYFHLVTDDETQPLREETSSGYMRPCPPRLPEGRRFEVQDEVDVWFNDGWWEGVISGVLADEKYVVYFSSTLEKLVFKKSRVRLHQEWTGGKWIVSSRA